VGTSFWDKFTNQRVSRRRAMQMAAIGGASAGAIAIVGCSSSKSSNNTPSAGASAGAGGTPSEGTPKAGGTLNGTVSLVLGMDPMKASTFLTHALASYSYSRLMRFKTTLGVLSQDQWYQPEPEVAAKVENPDPLTYIFTLRNDVKFHNVAPVNGRQVVAADVVYSFNRYRSISPNAADFSFVDTVTASADNTQVTFKLKEPFGLFLNRIASFQDLWIMPHEFIEQSANAADQSMLGSGPFMFDKYTAGSVIAWKKNPDYFEKDASGNSLPYLDAVNLAIITDQNQVLSQFAAGTLDTITVPPQLIDSFKSQNPNAIVDQSLNNILSFLYFDPLAWTANKPPFNDERVREAMDIALDRDAISREIAFGDGQVLGPVNPHLANGFWSLPRDEIVASQRGGDAIETRRAAAQGMLAAADAAGAHIRLQVAKMPQLLDVADVVASHLRQIGLIVDLETLDQLAWYVNFRRGDFDATIIGQLPYESPDQPTRMYHSGGVDGNGSMFGFSDPAIDALVERSWGEMDRGQRQQTLLDAQRRMIAARPMIQLFTSTAYSSAWSYVRNRRPGIAGAMAQYDYEQWIDKTT